MEEGDGNESPIISRLGELYCYQITRLLLSESRPIHNRPPFVDNNAINSTVNR